MKRYHVIGVMSGSSMDGIDLAHCELSIEHNQWGYQIHSAETIAYPEEWLVLLSGLPGQSALTYVETDFQYGKYIGGLVRNFVKRSKVKIDLIASHGHTIFHQPEKGLTAQIGHGAAIHAQTRLPVACDFRSVDVMLGGQGAPLVPLGDQLLFNEFDACLNLGGFANISYKKEGKRIAFDIVPCNIILNRIARMNGQEFDASGTMAAMGNSDLNLLSHLNSIPYYQNIKAKSLGREWVESDFWPIVLNSQISLNDKQATFCDHIARQISLIINQSKAQTILTTGGGAYNSHLIQCIRQLCQVQLILPEKNLIDFKEALIFAFLGVLRLRGEINVMHQITGASDNSISGALFGTK